MVAKLHHHAGAGRCAQHHGFHLAPPLAEIALQLRQHLAVAAVIEIGGFGGTGQAVVAHINDGLGIVELQATVVGNAALACLVAGAGEVAGAHRTDIEVHRSLHRFWRTAHLAGPVDGVRLGGQGNRVAWQRVEPGKGWLGHQLIARVSTVAAHQTPHPVPKLVDGRAQVQAVQARCGQRADLDVELKVFGNAQRLCTGVARAWIVWFFQPFVAGHGKNVLRFMGALDQAHVERVTFVRGKNGGGRVTHHTPGLQTAQATVARQLLHRVQRAVEVAPPALDVGQCRVDPGCQRCGCQDFARGGRHDSAVVTGGQCAVALGMGACAEHIGHVARAQGIAFNAGFLLVVKAAKQGIWRALSNAQRHRLVAVVDELCAWVFRGNGQWLGPVDWHLAVAQAQVREIALLGVDGLQRRVVEHRKIGEGHCIFTAGVAGAQRRGTGGFGVGVQRVRVLATSAKGLAAQTQRRDDVGTGGCGATVVAQLDGLSQLIGSHSRHRGAGPAFAIELRREVGTTNHLGALGLGHSGVAAAQTVPVQSIGIHRQPDRIAGLDDERGIQAMLLVRAGTEVVVGEHGSQRVIAALSALGQGGTDLIVFDRACVKDRVGVPALHGALRATEGVLFGQLLEWQRCGIGWAGAALLEAFAARIATGTRA